MTDKPENPLEGILSDFSLGPAWARAKTDSPKEKYKDGGEREYKPRRRDDDRGGRDNRNRQDDRRQGGGGNRRDFNKGGRGRPDFQREEIAPAEGVTVTLQPDKRAIQLVCKEVHQVARVYPLFDIARIILAERGRSRAIFEISEKKDPLYKCNLEEAVYLTREEALRHFLQADWRSKFVEESTVEVEPPKGNFQSVAKCGISGEWLGPPNYHAYQTEIRRIHRERFAHMPFEAYQAKVRVERSEEAVNEWLDSMKIQTRWRIFSEEEAAVAAIEHSEMAGQTTAEKIPANGIRPADPKTTPEESGNKGATEDSAAEPEPVTEEPAAEKPEAETVTEETASEPVQDESAAESEPSETPSDSPETEEPSEDQPEATPDQPEPAPPADDVRWFTDRAEVERAIAAEVLEKAFKVTRKATVSAAILGKNLSPGLLVRLKATGTHHRKHPAIIIPAICKLLEAEHMPVFKRKGKLFTGPARPHALAPDAVLAPRPAEMVKWIRENTPAKLEGLWKAVLPEGATAPPAEYAADLFWLLQQGHILLYTDDTLVVQEQPKPQQPKKPKQPKKKAAPVETVAANCIRPAESGSNLEEPTANVEPLPQPTEAANESISESEEAPPASKEPSPEPVEATTEAPAEATEPAETSTEIKEAAAPEPTEASDESKEPSPEESKQPEEKATTPETATPEPVVEPSTETEAPSEPPPIDPLP